MIKWFILALCCMYIYHALTKSYCNPYKLIIMFGPKGCGKSTTLTKLAAHDVQSGKTVYTNFGLPGSYPMEPSSLGKIDFGREVSIYIDEGALTWDNRQFKKFDVATLEWFRLQRHYRTRVYISSQSYDLDAKIRMLADELWIYRRFMRVFSVGRRVIKKIQLVEAGRDGTESRIVDNLAFDFFLFPSAWSITFIPRYVGLFDSFSVHMKLFAYTFDKTPQAFSVPRLSASVWAFVRSGVLGIVSDVKRLVASLRAVKRAVDESKPNDMPTEEEIAVSLNQTLEEFFGGMGD